MMFSKYAQYALRVSFSSGVYDWPVYICLWCLFLGCALASNEVCIWLLSIYGFFALPKVGSV